MSRATAPVAYENTREVRRALKKAKPLTWHRGDGDVYAETPSGSYHVSHRTPDRRHGTLPWLLLKMTHGFSTDIHPGGFDSQAEAKQWAAFHAEGCGPAAPAPLAVVPSALTAPLALPPRPFMATPPDMSRADWASEARRPQTRHGVEVAQYGRFEIDLKHVAGRLTLFWKGDNTGEKWQIVGWYPDYEKAAEGANTYLRTNVGVPDIEITAKDLRGSEAGESRHEDLSWSGSENDCQTQTSIGLARIRKEPGYGEHVFTMDGHELKRGEDLEKLKRFVRSFVRARSVQEQPGPRPQGYEQEVRDELAAMGSPDAAADVKTSAKYIEAQQGAGTPANITAAVIYATLHHAHVHNAPGKHVELYEEGAEGAAEDHGGMKLWMVKYKDESGKEYEQFVHAINSQRAIDAADAEAKKQGHPRDDSWPMHAGVDYYSMREGGAREIPTGDELLFVPASSGVESARFECGPEESGRYEIYKERGKYKLKFWWDGDNKLNTSIGNFKTLAAAKNEANRSARARRAKFGGSAAAEGTSKRRLDWKKVLDSPRLDIWQALVETNLFVSIVNEKGQGGHSGFNLHIGTEVLAGDNLYKAGQVGSYATLADAKAAASQKLEEYLAYRKKYAGYEAAETKTDYVLMYAGATSKPYVLLEMAITEARALSKPGSYGGEVFVVERKGAHTREVGVARNGVFVESARGARENGDGDEEDDFDLKTEMETGLVIGEARGGKYSVSIEGKYLDSFKDFDAAVLFGAQQMQNSNYFPNVFYVNERGNTDLLSLKPKVIKGKVIKVEYKTIRSWV